MKFITHSNDYGFNIDVGGTSYQGHIDAGYKDLVAVFGEPHNQGDPCKIDAEWDIQFEDNTIATIYNYKDGINYNGEENGTPTHEIRDWHIGGYSEQAGKNVEQVLNDYRNRQGE